MAKDRPEIRPALRAGRAIPQILKDLRALRVCVFHPRDQDGEELTRQLERIGCQVQAFWPPLPTLPDGVDLVFMALSPDILDTDFAWCASDEAPPVIAVIAYENPTIIEAVLRIGAKATVASPIRSFGLLSALVLARELGGTIKKQKNASCSWKPNWPACARLPRRRTSCASSAASLKTRPIRSFASRL